MTDASAAGALIDQIERDHGGLDVLVNNAGIDRTAAVDEMSVEPTSAATWASPTRTPRRFRADGASGSPSRKL